jgi:hypothetical protein
MHPRASTIFHPIFTPARAHEHQPGETDEQARIVQFYKTWLRPKGDFSIPHRQNSCCFAAGDSQDCFPVLADRDVGHGHEIMLDVEGASTLAQSHYGGRWFPVKDHIEENIQPDPRESPDGRSHACVTQGGVVVCYVPGYGG